MVGYGRHEGLGYFIHEYETAQRLSARLAECGGRLPYQTALQVMVQITAAVSAAHKADVVVGGVRPQDVRLVPSERRGLQVGLRNFGLAALLGVPAGRSGDAEHPSIYRAPEADVGRDAASDVFSLGVLFIRLLTGPLPPTASGPEHAAVMRKRLHQALRDTALSDGVAMLLAESVDQDLTLRPDDATALLDRLRAVAPATVTHLAAMGEFCGSRSDQPSADDGPDPSWADLGAYVPGELAEPDSAAVPDELPSESSGVIEVAEDPNAASDVLPIPRDEDSEDKIVVADEVPATKIRGPRPRPRARSLRHRPTTRTKKHGGSMPIFGGTIGRLALGVGMLCGGTAVAVAATVSGALSSPNPEEPAAIAAAESAGPLPNSVVEAPAAKAAGTLLIDSAVVGSLMVDGQRVGSTSEPVALAPGLHIVRVEADGHEIWRSRVEIDPGGEHRLVADLVALR